MMNFAAYLFGKPYIPPDGTRRSICPLTSEAERSMAVGKKAVYSSAENRERVFKAIQAGARYIAEIAALANLSVSPTLLHCHALADQGRVRRGKESHPTGGQRLRFEPASKPTERRARRD